MKKFLVYILIFFASVVVIDQLVGMAGDYMWHHSKPSPNKQFDDLCQKDKHDVLIMGSSRALHHYVPQIFEESLGVNVYNAGYDGNGIILSYGILQMIIDRYAPKLIIYDIEPSFDIEIYEPDNDRTRYLSELKRYNKHRGVSKILRDVSYGTYLMSYSGFCRYNSDLLEVAAYFINGGEYYEKGYKPLFGQMKSYNEERKRVEKFRIDSVKVNYLHKFIQCCSDNDIQVILAISPKFGDNKTYLQDFIGKLSDQYNVPVIDYCNDNFFQTDMALFNDRMHLNDKGANVYSEKVVHYITQNINVTY